MDEVTVNLTGIDELEQAFTNGSERAVRKFLRNTEMKAAKVLQQRASDNAPYAEGILAADIKRESTQLPDGVRIRTGPGRESFYGVFQELGAPEANVAAQHWLEGAAKEAADDILAALIEAFQDGLREMR